VIARISSLVRSGIGRETLEWRPTSKRGWSLFTELGTQHDWGNSGPSRFYDGGNARNCHSADAVRIAAGSTIQIREKWWIGPRVGISGSFREPSPIAAIAFTRILQSDP
jgi:hypothetical protein